MTGYASTYDRGLGELKWLKVNLILIRGLLPLSSADHWQAPSDGTPEPEVFKTLGMPLSVAVWCNTGRVHCAPLVAQDRLCQADCGPSSGWQTVEVSTRCSGSLFFDKNP